MLEWANRMLDWEDALSRRLSVYGPLGESKNPVVLRKKLDEFAQRSADAVLAPETWLSDLDIQEEISRPVTTLPPYQSIENVDGRCDGHQIGGDGRESRPKLRLHATERIGVATLDERSASVDSQSTVARGVSNDWREHVGSLFRRSAGREALPSTSSDRVGAALGACSPGGRERGDEPEAPGRDSRHRERLRARQQS
jgi:hypothetical protein